MSKTVIVGGVAGGASCAARLRRLDESAQIILLERGEYISYANCGLPYYVGDVIRSRDALLLQTPEIMRARFNVDVRTKNEVISIDREKKTVSVKRLDTGEVYEQDYDNLVLATGSSPVRPPIPGIESPRIKTLWTIPDTDELHALVHDSGIKSAAVIGGGFIGLEMAENLHHAGLDVTIVEMLDQVMAPIDYEMAQLLHENIEANGIRLSLGDGVDSFFDDGSRVTITLKSGKTISAELVILSIGVRPNSELAKAAGISINARGGVVIDANLRTSDPNIYAVGDVIEVEDVVFGDRTMVPLAGPANKQGRIAADNIAGGSETYSGTQGTSVAKVFDLTVASTGANEKALIKRGLVKGRDFESVIITQNSHASYYPGATPIFIKLLFSVDGKKLFGAQVVGHEGVDKRIDTIAVALRLGGGVAELTQLELAYAPPFSSAKDPVNMAGFVAENALTGKIRFSDWDAVEKMQEAILLDVREDAELMAFSIPNAVGIPFGQLRDRLGELDKTKPVIVFCAIGVRSYNAARILMQHGFENVLLYPAGTRFYQSTHYRLFSVPVPAAVSVDMAPKTTAAEAPAASIRLDCSGMQCPGPIMKVFETSNKMQDGQVLEVVASDPGFVKDIAAWCRRTGNTLLSNEKRGADYVAQVKKGLVSAAVTHAADAAPIVRETPQGKTIIVFSGDLDKVLASFIIANGAAAMGRPVTMFFTFWGLTVLRKAEKQPVKKTFMESMFGSMLPRGSGKLKLSRMNMGGMGTAMMKRIMNDKNVDSLEALIQKAIGQGVKIVACTMSMDVMGIKAEELIDGVELGGVGAYLGDAEESNVNLFI
ncbi:MAG: pyridine nucleotide-disulfide oxidoreductase [Clostridia bacterium]|nr:pyridine nucleotide-disulfide oxidoreductase [Clostridia bacterium]